MTALVAQPELGLLTPDFTPEHTLFIDFETYWSPDFTLTKLGTERYVRDDRFETIGVSIDDGDECVWLEHEEFKEWAKGIPWEKCAVGAHNTAFDGLILAWHYDIFPGFYIDTLSMGRALHGSGHVSLEKLMPKYGLGEKGHEVTAAKGKHRSDFTQAEWLQYGAYSMNDAQGCKGLWYGMAEQFPESELHLIDMTMRAFCDPQFVLDEPLLTQYLIDERKRKQAMLDNLSDTPQELRSVLMSNDKFAALLVSLGVEPPRKISVAKTKTARELDPKAPAVETYAFAKSDPGMQIMLEHNDDTIRWLAEARVATKSTINETRTERFLNLGKNGRAMPVFLRYCLGGDTPVLTRRGWRPITEVKLTDEVWDGEEWVTHSGLLYQGEMKVVEGHGLCVTPEHEVLTEDGWKEWKSTLDNPSLFQSALNMVGLPSSSGEFARTKADVRLVGSLLSGAGVGMRHLFTSGISTMESGLSEVVRSVDGLLGLFTKRPCQTTFTELGCSAGSTASLIGARTRKTYSTNTMEDAGSPFIRNGLRTEKLFSGLFRRFLGGTTRNSISTESKTKAHTLQGTSDSSLDRLTATTEGRWPHSKRRSNLSQEKMKVYDLLSCGPRSRFVILSSAGPIIVHNCGAHTWRFSGGDGTNWQNLERTDKKKPEKGALRRAVLAPHGKKVVVADSSQIEARVSAWVAGDAELLTEFATGADIYSNFASIIYQRKVDRKNNPEDFIPGFLAKCSILGLGYGMGWYTFSATLLRGMLGGPPTQFTAEDASKLDVDVERFIGTGKWAERKLRRIQGMPARIALEERVIHCAVANKLVQTYREKRSAIVDAWGMMDQVISTMESCAEGEQFGFGPDDCFRAERHAVVMPCGVRLAYPGLELRQQPDYEDENGEIVEGRAYYSYLGAHNQRAKLYSGLMFENLVQSAARFIITDQVLHMKAAYGLRPASTTHDEIIYVVDENKASWTSQVLLDAMKTPPSWAKGLPLAAEGGWGTSYGSAK